MFQECVRRTPLTGSPADTVFQNINGEMYRDDVSFVSTLRMILHGRIPADGGLYFFSKYSDRHPSRYRTDYAKNDIESCIGREEEGIDDDTLEVVYLGLYEQSDRDRVMKFIDDNFLECFSGWAKMEKVTGLFAQKFNVLCFYNIGKRSTIVFVERMDYKIYHVLQTAVAGFFPWYFKKEESADISDEACNREELMELLYSLREKTSDKYYACLSKFADRFDFRTLKIKNGLRGFESIELRQRLRGVERSLDEIRENIEELYRSVSENIRRKYSLDIEYAGIQTKLASGEVENEIMDYFLANNCMVLEDVVGSRVTFGCKTYLEFFDEEFAKSVIRNRNSFVYTNARGPISGEDMGKLLTAIFVDGKLKIRVCAAYFIDITGNFDGISNFNYGSIYDGYLPNPHINRFHCVGNYRQEVYECLNNHNYVMAFEHALSSARSLNFNDSPVMGEFMQNMYGYSKSTGFIETPDGELLTPVQAVEWVKAQEG